ncbi:MAG: porin family protein [Bacteroidales bacterium]
MGKNLLQILFIFFISIGINQQIFAQVEPDPVLNDPDYDQEKRLRFGFSLGVNFMDFRITSDADFQQDDNNSYTQYFVDNSRLIPGFNVNVISDFRIVPTFHVRFMPGLAFGQRDLYFYLPDGELVEKMNLESSFIEIPLTFKYSAARKTNTRPYLIAGTNFRIDMAAYKKLNIEEGVLLRLAKGDFYYEFGFGLDYFLTYFKFSTEIKFSSGFRNVLAHDFADEGEDFARSIKRLQSQLITISFHFE